MTEMETLSRDTCLRLLPSEGTGWVTCADRHGRPALRPVDFVVHEGEVVFRTCYHDKVAEVLQETWVTLGFSALDERHRSGWWVTVTGQARLVGDDLVNPGLPHRECWLEPGAGLLVGVPLADVHGHRLEPSSRVLEGWTSRGRRSAGRRRPLRRHRSERASVGAA
ncbi:pyridoxamine 5'-phosphate oxidase-like protein [Georgenia muralis]|uniref:Pyridoxamine 5'-phosphate oxidase-like protein n=2 Tax=Georgenia muralis TaxID=154117 RepID=A0A3N4Z2D3_9MICO|nr:pyridoxamine 5'-phosphate oxidase-like protein [Georgenia muralis]